MKVLVTVMIMKNRKFEMVAFSFVSPIACCCQVGNIAKIAYTETVTKLAGIHLYHTGLTNRAAAKVPALVCTA